jgi:hypothetical protein
MGGYWYVDDPGKINRGRALEIKVLKAPDGDIVDATAVVAYYLRTLPDRTVDTEINRINILKPLPKPIGGSKEIQPLAGVIRPEYLIDTHKKDHASGVHKHTSKGDKKPTTTKPAASIDSIKYRSVSSSVNNITITQH